MKHTPGPWKCWDASDILFTDEVAVERIGPEAGGGVTAEASDIRLSKADAHLIAAAPELLDSLIEAQAIVCSERCPSVWATGTPQPHTPECERARAAIQKAEGEDAKG